MPTMRASSTQKAYDDAFLACSTAVYFESQNNEAEALRSWKGALDHIYYHNAHRVPSSYRPASETEKALQDSLRQLELQCKERVDILEALRQSRNESETPTPMPSAGGEPKAPTPPPHGVSIASSNSNRGTGWLGGGTIPPVEYTHLSRPPPLPARPSLPARNSSGQDANRMGSLTQTMSGASLAPASAGRKDSRTPSPDKKARMKKTLRPEKGRRSSSTKLATSMRTTKPPEAAKAATQAWGFKTMPGTNRPGLGPTKPSSSSQNASSARPAEFERPSSGLESDATVQTPEHEPLQPPAPFYFRSGLSAGSAAYAVPPSENASNPDLSKPLPMKKDPPPPSAQRNSVDLGKIRNTQGNTTALPAYRNEFPAQQANPRMLAASAAARSWTDIESERARDSSFNRKPVPTPPPAPLSPSNNRPRKAKQKELPDAIPIDENGNKPQRRPARRKAKASEDSMRADLPSTPTSDAEDTSNEPSGDESDEWKERVKHIMKNLPKGVDEQAAQQILNEIVIQGDQVRWSDVAGLEVAKSALKETVVYPFLRPDLFMGLREPARGMLLFGPPGTGKTMLARAVATESKSTFFAISASSLTSKFMGESEKLVRALFALAKLLAPSIIFVDEIDSLLSERSGSGEHEATRRIKTEFLIQWSDLQKAAAGREQSTSDKDKGGDASRVLVLAATNLPWAIDEAARRRFVRRQYIPLPEDWVRRDQVITLLSHQKHVLGEEDLRKLVQWTEGFSGSDITALAKDAAMQPLRSLGEKLLDMTMDEIRPICLADFEQSLLAIRPSVSREGLRRFDEWAREFGERGG